MLSVVVTVRPPYGLYINRLLGRPQGRVKELWASQQVAE